MIISQNFRRYFEYGKIKSCRCKFRNGLEWDQTNGWSMKESIHKVFRELMKLMQEVESRHECCGKRKKFYEAIVWSPPPNIYVV